VAESTLSRLDPLQRERLGALGIDLLALRPGVGTASRPAEAFATNTGILRLRVLGADQAFANSPDAKLLQALVAALGLRPDEVSSAPGAGVPVLAFALDVDGDAIQLPALDRLRNADAKRAAWPALRRLRRALRGAGRPA
jgi:hypothetical protein